MVDDEAIEKMKNGVEIGIHGVKYKTKPCQAFRLNPTPIFPERTKKIRDDKGYWNQIESYIQDHSEAEFSHSICKE